MKNIYLFLVIVLSAPYLRAQNPTKIEFNEAVPIWHRIMVDTTFIPLVGQPNFNKYNSLSPISIHRHENHIYLMASSKERRTLYDYGFVLDKLDKDTGHLLWSHHNTQYIDGHNDFYHNLYFDGDKIEMVGVVKEEVELFSSYKALNKQTGILDRYTKSSWVLPSFYNRYFNGLVYVNDSLFINTYSVGEQIGSSESYNYGVNTEVYDRNMTLLNNVRFLFDFENLGPFSIDQPNFTRRLNKNTLVSLAYKDRFDSWDNLGTKMMWVDISDPFKIDNFRLKDYTDLVPGTKETFLNQRFIALNNTIFLSHRYPNFDIQQNVNYLLWLDSIGEIKTFIPVVHHNNHFYTRTHIIHANDDYAYLLADPSSTGRYGYDILKIYNGVDTVSFVSSITTKKNDEEFGAQINAVFEDDYLIFGGFTRYSGERPNTYTGFHCFKASDLGMTFGPVNTNDVIKKYSDFKIYPNPTANTLYLKLDHFTEGAKLLVYNMNGQVVVSDYIKENYNAIDVSNLHVGMYYLKVIDGKGEQIGEVKKIVKVE